VKYLNDRPGGKVGFLYFFLITFCISILLYGCMPAPYFQKEEGIPQNAWNANFKPAFTFDITDTNAAYQSYFLIRHTQAYPYSNIWLWVYAKTPGDSIIKKARINIVMAEPSGKWLGRGMGEIYEQRMPVDLSSIVNFRKAGTYRISFEQNMRINPLPEILNVGLCVEKLPFRPQ
jgi:gliding motility-associated lipoprotein GldH